MRLKITVYDVNFSLTSLEEHISRLELTEFVQIVDTAEDAISVDIRQTEEGVLLVAPALDFERICKYENIADELLALSGYKKTLLTGLSVKDSEGKKYRPVIEIFSFGTPAAVVPDTLQYVKTSLEGHNSPVKKKRIHFNSEILTSLLDGTSINFRDSNNYYEAISEGDRYFLSFRCKIEPLCLDFIIDETVNNNMAKYMKIKRKYPMFEHFLTGKLENIVFNKSFYKKIKNSKDDIEDLVSFVEHAPKFQDGRDDLIRQLEDFVYKNYPYIHIQKYQYLDVYKAKLPKNKCKNSIRNLLWGEQ